jgi:hypothetical protein
MQDRNLCRSRSATAPIAVAGLFNETPVPMKTKLTEIVRQRQALGQELNQVRQHSLNASRREDFRGVARFTLEAARLNRAISDCLTNEELAQ